MSKDKEKNCKFTTVRTGYARAAILLTAVNLLATGYVVTKLAELHSPVQDSQEVTTTVTESNTETTDTTTEETTNVSTQD